MARQRRLTGNRAMRILIILIPDGAGGTPPVLRFDRFLEPYYLFVDAGIDLVLASPAGGDPLMRSRDGGRRAHTPLMARFMRDWPARDALSDTLGLAQVDLADFDGAFCIGAHGGTHGGAHGDAAGDDPADGPTVRTLRSLLRAGKPLAVVPGWIGPEGGPPVSGDGLLIIGNGAAAPGRAARALMAAIGGAPA
jgi:hypothetical protein